MQKGSSRLQGQQASVTGRRRLVPDFTAVTATVIGLRFWERLACGGTNGRVGHDRTFLRSGCDGTARYRMSTCRRFRDLALVRTMVLLTSWTALLFEQDGIRGHG